MFVLGALVLCSGAAAGLAGEAAVNWPLAKESRPGTPPLQTSGEVRLGEPMTDWERRFSEAHLGDGHAAVLTGGHMEGLADSKTAVSLADDFTVYIRLQATNRAWQAGILALLDDAGRTVARVYGEDRSQGQNMELVFEAYAPTGASHHVRLPLKPLRLGVWHDLFFVVRGQQLILFVEGLRKGHADLPRPLAGGRLARCCIGTDGTERSSFLGQIDHVLVWDRALTEEEIRQAGGRSHAEELAMAEERCALAGPRVARDPARPTYHLTPPAGLMTDPDGPVSYNGTWHFMYQIFPWFLDEEQMMPGWGHLASSDHVHWEHWPVAMMPVPGSYDAAACASGCCVIDDQGVPTIVYTSVPPQAQSIATSRDGMRTWEKYEGNPVIPGPPAIEGIAQGAPTPSVWADGFRDPFVWKEDDGWYMVVGSAIDKVGGTALLYRSKDLRDWEYLHPLCTGTDPDCFQWEVPTFLPLGDKYMFIVCPLLHSSPELRADVIYSIGTTWTTSSYRARGRRSIWADTGTTVHPTASSMRRDAASCGA